jgi:hypothetical protein
MSFHSVDYNFTKRPPREVAATGTHIAAKVVLMPATKFPELVTSMSQQFTCI